MVLVADVLCIGGIFPIYYGFFPVICSWSFVHQSSMFRVVDVLCAVSYTVAEYEWIFPLCCGFFPVIHSWSFVHQSSIRKVVNILCAVSYTVSCWGWMDMFLSVMDFSCVSWSTPCSSL